MFTLKYASKWDHEVESESEDGKRVSHKELRPWWQRMALCMGLGIGSALFLAPLLYTRSRTVRSISLLPPSFPYSSERNIFIQCVHNWRSNGTVFPRDRCHLVPTGNGKELRLQIDGEKREWFLDLDRALVRGRPAPVIEAREEIMELWGKHSEKAQASSS